MKPRRGSTMIELALLLAVLTPVAAGGLRFAWSFYLIDSLQDAVAQAAAQAAHSPAATSEALQKAATEKALAAGVPWLDASHVRVEIEPGPSGEPRWIAVSIHGYDLPTPFSSTRLEGKPRARFPYLVRTGAR
ncbi:MAG: hypothetical protein R2729_11930 [Bryobacteraceae bacterium]